MTNVLPIKELDAERLAAVDGFNELWKGGRGDPAFDSTSRTFQKGRTLRKLWRARQMALRRWAGGPGLTRPPSFGTSLARRTSVCGLSWRHK
jgi:hypothetical protein